MISTVDPQARHAHKSVSRRQDGFKAHLAVEPDTGLVTACQLTKAAGADSHDAVVGIDLLTDETEHLQVLGDSAYGTGEALAALAETGHEVLIKPWPTQSAVPGGFTIEDFTVDLTARTMTCPAGQTVPISPSGAASFGSRCAGCPLAAQCTTARTRPDREDQRALRGATPAPPSGAGPSLARRPTASTDRWSNARSPG